MAIEQQGTNTFASIDQTIDKVKFIAVTQNVDLDTMESDITTNNAKVTYNTTDSTKVGFISVTQAVDLDAIESASHAIATVSDSTTVDLTLTGQDIEAAVIAVPNEATGVLKFWTGTQAAYDLLTPAATTLYFIEE